MAKKNKNEDSSAGLILLVLILIGAVAYVYIYDQKKKAEENKPAVEKKEEPKYNEETYEKLYKQIKLEFNEENSFVKKEIAELDKEKTTLNFTDDLKIIYSMNNIYNNYLENDYTKRANVAKDYVYSGKYVKTSKLNNICNLFLGTKFTPKTVITNTEYYLYDQKTEAIYIYKRNFDSKINKVTHYAGSYDDEYIYIDEFVAYTNTTTNPALSYTYHINLLPIDITEKNITENLDIIDHFKYTFKYIEANNVFQLVKVEYIKPNE